MEMTKVKCEMKQGRRRLCMADSEASEIKCLKRRRREPIAAVLGRVDHHGEQQQLNQSSTSTTVKRSSRFRGVSRHRWTGRFEAHLWDKGSWNVTQKKKGKQVYLGAYDEEESAARAYDLAALKYWGTTTFTNFPVSDYDNEIRIMQNVTKEEYLASLRRKSSGFSRGVSKYRGVARHHHNGRWEARIGRVFGNKYLYLGTYSTQEEAAHAYDIAAIEYRGINAVTNFDLSTYIRWLRPGGNAHLTSQEQQTIVESKAEPSSSNLIPNEEVELSFIHANPFTTEDLGSQKQVLQIKSSASSCNKSSSPTALGLLFRSSVFRDLVEKNSNSTSTDNENDRDDMGQQPAIGSDDEYGGVFYEGMADIPYECSTANTLPDNEFQGQSLWNGVLSIPSTHSSTSLKWN